MESRLSVGLREFLIKSFVFVVLFVLIQLVVMGLVAKTSLPGDLKLIAMDDLAEAALFVLVLFIGFNREKILKVKSYSVGLLERALSGAVVVIGLFIYFSYKSFLMSNLSFVSAYVYLVTILEFFILFIILFFLVNMVFGWRFCRDFFVDYRFGLLYSLVGVGFIYFAVKEFQGLWIYLSGAVAGLVVYLLGLIGVSHLYYANELPVLVYNDFTVGIAATCSGIDSVLLFTGLYLGILAWDWKVLDKRKAIGMYFVGVLGAVVLNVIRIFLLVLIGAYISRDFALNTFHTNASSLLFIVYFAVFWKFLYKWMKTS